jgi:hypothetical protein
MFIRGAKNYPVTIGIRVWLLSWQDNENDFVAKSTD